MYILADARCRRSNSSINNHNKNNNPNQAKTRVNAATTARGGKNAAMAFLPAHAAYAPPFIRDVSTRQKQPTKPRSKAIVAPRLRTYISSNRRVVGLGSIATDPSAMVAASRVGSESGRSGVLRFKRCRLSSSPATDLVGMQANIFLNDSFGCLGFLPLATAILVRQAMVNIRIGPIPQKGQQER